MQAGELRERIGFFRPVVADDGFGNTTSGYAAEPDFVVSANVRPKLGGESIQAARLAGRNYLNVTVRAASITRQVTDAWKARNMRSETDYNIRSIIDPDGKRQWIEMLCEEGVAV